MSDSQRWMALLVAVLATWRLCHLLAHEDGPLDLVLNLRRRAGTSMWGVLMDCPYCLSLWRAMPFAAWLADDWGLGLAHGLALWLGISGGASLVEKLSCPTDPD
jgi:hypothetical protein